MRKLPKSTYGQGSKKVIPLNCKIFTKMKKSGGYFVMIFLCGWIFLGCKEDDGFACDRNPTATALI
jgi:hypothetical protein